MNDKEKEELAVKNLADELWKEDRRVIGSSISYSTCRMIARTILSLGYRKQPDPPEELVEAVRQEIKPLVKNYVLSYIHNLSQLNSEIARVFCALFPTPELKDVPERNKWRYLGYS